MNMLVYEGRPGRKPRYPFRAFEVGDTMFFPNANGRDMTKRMCRLKPMKFKRRTVVKDGTIGVRIWRIA